MQNAFRRLPLYADVYREAVKQLINTLPDTLAQLDLSGAFLSFNDQQSLSFKVGL